MLLPKAFFTKTFYLRNFFLSSNCFTSPTSSSFVLEERAAKDDKPDKDFKEDLAFDSTAMLKNGASEALLADAKKLQALSEAQRLGSNPRLRTA